MILGIFKTVSTKIKNLAYIQNSQSVATMPKADTPFISYQAQTYSIHIILKLLIATYLCPETMITVCR